MKQLMLDGQVIAEVDDEVARILLALAAERPGRLTGSPVIIPDAKVEETSMAGSSWRQVKAETRVTTSLDLEFKRSHEFRERIDAR